jgi:hypothetical protein
MLWMKQNIITILLSRIKGCICSPEMLTYHLNLTDLLSSGNIGKRIGSADGQNSGRGLNVQRFFLNCAYFHPVYEIRDVQATLLSLSCRRNVVYWKEIMRTSMTCMLSISSWFQKFYIDVITRWNSDDIQKPWKRPTYT